ncbi:hypothetical protein CDAR_219281 [Caerostris darwini]|uniref:Uncharacterized protein n=1 Tax=Caerostris darwini TaxID=1538125 RepID=A0AAV4PNA1_9ARAC|nr:hypothetical protein CDAR_219281 [Caerostris darwini]
MDTGYSTAKKFAGIDCLNTPSRVSLLKDSIFCISSVGEDFIGPLPGLISSKLVAKLGTFRIPIRISGSQMEFIFRFADGDADPVIIPNRIITKLIYVDAGLFDMMELILKGVLFLIRNIRIDFNKMLLGKVKN